MTGSWAERARTTSSVRPATTSSTGRDSSDTLWPGPGNDLVLGEGGTVDRVSYELASGPVSVNLTTGEATGEGTDTLTGINDIEGSLFDDLLIGERWSNEIVGGLGDDEIHGMGRQDKLFGSAGDDEVYGGGGDDVLDGGVGQEDGLGDIGDGGDDEDLCTQFETSLNCELKQSKRSSNTLKLQRGRGRLRRFGAPCTSRRDPR